MTRKTSIDEYDYLLKMVLVGDSGVGKSCLLKRFAQDEFDSTYISTIGVDFEIITLEIMNKQVRLQIWDTAGQERFHNITTSYYRGAHCIALIYDVTSEESFSNIKLKWLEAIQTYGSNDVQMILIGNKSDLSREREVMHDTAQQFSDLQNIPLIETSAKENVNVNEAFKLLAQLGVKNMINKDNERKYQNTMNNNKKNEKVNLNNQNQANTNSSGWCCNLI